MPPYGEVHANLWARFKVAETGMMNKARARTGHLDFLNRSYSDMVPNGRMG